MPPHRRLRWANLKPFVALVAENWSSYEDVSPVVTVALVKRAFATTFDISIVELICQRRTASIVAPRSMAMAVSRRLTACSLPEIGRRFGGRDHTTVMHACRKYDRPGRTGRIGTARDRDRDGLGPRHEGRVMTEIALSRDRWHRTMACPSCGHEIGPGTAVEGSDPWAVELVCQGCHVTLGTIEFDPVDDDGRRVVTDLSAYRALCAAKKPVPLCAGLARVPELNGTLFPPPRRTAVDFALRAGRAGLFYDTGLGKTAMMLEWGRVVVETTNRPVLMLAPARRWRPACPGGRAARHRGQGVAVRRRPGPALHRHHQLRAAGKVRPPPSSPASSWTKARSSRASPARRRAS